jgi:hypothetical protein
MLIPSTVTQLFSATCFDYDGANLPALEGVHGFPVCSHLLLFPVAAASHTIGQQFSYNSDQIRTDWKIVPENEADESCGST